jgi:Tfp pilus assembly PilM family ATPase
MPHGGAQVDQALADELGVAPDVAKRLRQYPELIETGADETAEDILARCLNPWLRAMHSEIDRCLQYHRSVFREAGSVNRVIFTGGGAQDKMLCQGIARALKLPAQIGDPLVGLSVAKGIDIGNDGGGMPDLAVSVGLSLSGH